MSVHLHVTQSTCKQRLPDGVYSVADDGIYFPLKRKGKILAYTIGVYILCRFHRLRCDWRSNSHTVS
jgi:hypothetical protein